MYDFKGYLLLSFVLIIFGTIVCYRVGGRCGLPGQPFATEIQPKKTVYEDGDDIRYTCPGDRIYAKIQVQKCVSGRWTGPRPTCGTFIRNFVLVRIQVIDLIDNRTIVDKDTSINKTEENEKDAPNYYDDRGTFVVVPRPHRTHKWIFTYEGSIQFDMFLVNLRIPRLPGENRGSVNEIDYIKVRDVVVESEHNRTCSLDFTTRQNQKARVFWFWCTPSNDSSKTLVISFVTYTKDDHVMDKIGLHQAYLTKVQYCGQPAVPLLTKLSLDGEGNEKVMCDSEMAIEAQSSSNSSYLQSDENVSHDCIVNEHWAGNPKCVPKIYCPIDQNRSSEVIDSVKNAYIFTDEEWYAIDGTKVTYKCEPGYELVEDSVRTCHACRQCDYATWDKPGPVCQEVKTLGLSANVLLAIVLTSALFVIAIIALVVIIVRKVNHKNQMIATDKPVDKELDVYDDTAGEEEYADYQYNEYNEYQNAGEYYKPVVQPKERYQTRVEMNKSTNSRYLALEDGQDYNDQYVKVADSSRTHES